MRPKLGAQGQCSDEGMRVVSMVGPAGHWLLTRDEAYEWGLAILRAVADADRF